MRLFSGRVADEDRPILSPMDRPRAARPSNYARAFLVTAGLGLVLLGMSIRFHPRVIAGFQIARDRLEIATVQRGVFREFITVDGTVLPVRSVAVISQEGGRVEKVLVEEGSRVEPGQPLVVLSNPDLQMKVTRQEARLAEQRQSLQTLRIAAARTRFEYEERLKDLEFRLERQKRRLARNELLRANGLLSRRAYDEDRDTYAFLQKKRDWLQEASRRYEELARAQLRELERNLETQESNLRILREKMAGLTVRAPIRGQVSGFRVDVGQYLEPRRPMGRIDDTSDYRVRVRLSEYYLDRVRPGLRGRFRASGTGVYPVVLDKIYPGVKDGTVQAILRFTGEHPRRLVSGQTARVELELGGSAAALLLPRGGFITSTGGRWVFVLDPSGRAARRRPVRLGRQNPEYYEVLEGLRAGDRVIISSYEGFADRRRIGLKP